MGYFTCGNMVVYMWEYSGDVKFTGGEKVYNERGFTMREGMSSLQEGRRFTMREGLQ